MTEGQQGGEFYTPSSIVRLLVEILEPYHGRILDPACGSGGMFVQSARFVAEHKTAQTPSPAASRHPLPVGEGRGEGLAAKYSGDPGRELSIAGQEKVAATVNLCRMNLAVHGLEGDIRQAITYYEDLHQACAPCSAPSTRPVGRPSPSGRRAGDEGVSPRNLWISVKT